jgi:hypothetical protein
MDRIEMSKKMTLIDLINKRINPNCSEIIAKLPSYERMLEVRGARDEIRKFDITKKTRKLIEYLLDQHLYDETISIQTDSHPKGAREEMQWVAENFIEHKVLLNDIPPLLFVENDGGGGNWDAVERSWDLAKLTAIGALTEEEVKEWDDVIWSCPNEIKLSEQCKRCLDGIPENDCQDKERFLKRLVGECDGIPGKEYIEIFYEILNRELQKEKKVVDKSE